MLQNPRYIYGESKTENGRNHEYRHDFWIFCHLGCIGLDELWRRLRLSSYNGRDSRFERM